MSATLTKTTRRLPKPSAPAATEPTHKPIWEIFKEAAEALPDTVVAQLPTDGAEQHDHYLYGTPKKVVA